MQVWSRALLLLASIACTAACTDASGPVDIFVITFDTQAKEFRLEAERVETIDSVSHARGSTTRLIKEPLAKIFENGEIELSGGDPPNILFTESGGAIVPEDWDSLTLLSYYHHLEKAAAWFRDTLGFAAVDEIMPITSYYRLEVGFDQSVIGMTDNAAYVPTVHSFLLFDNFLFDDLPMAMNDGVVTHELSHAVFHRVMNGEEKLPQEYREGWERSAIAHLGAVHEGQADVFAAMMLDEPDFFRFSLPHSVENRDMTEARVLTAAQLHNLGRGSVDVHEIGAVIAAAIWTFSEIHGRERTAELTLEAEEALGPDLDGSFHIADFLIRFMDAGDAQEQEDAAAIFCERFLAIADRFPSGTCAP